MAFKAVFDENGHYTEDASRITADISEVIRPFFYQGYSPRDIMTLIALQASMEMSVEILKAGLNKYKERKQNPALSAEQNPEG